jgi:hypothetical protein
MASSSPLIVTTAEAEATAAALLQDSRRAVWTGGAVEALGARAGQDVTPEALAHALRGRTVDDGAKVRAATPQGPGRAQGVRHVTVGLDVADAESATTGLESSGRPVAAAIVERDGAVQAIVFGVRKEDGRLASPTEARFPGKDLDALEDRARAAAATRAARAPERAEAPAPEPAHAPEPAPEPERVARWHGADRVADPLEQVRAIGGRDLAEAVARRAQAWEARTEALDDDRLTRRRAALRAAWAPEQRSSARMTGSALVTRQRAREDGRDDRVADQDAVLGALREGGRHFERHVEEVGAWVATERASLLRAAQRSAPAPERGAGIDRG